MERNSSAAPLVFSISVDLVNLLEQEKAAGNAGRLAFSLLRMDLVILDELGDLPFSPSGGALLSGSTFAADWIDGPKKWWTLTGDTPTLTPILIYGGADSHEQEHCWINGPQHMARR